jgi:hypothetical protein
MFSRNSYAIASLALAVVAIASCGKSGPAVTAAGSAAASSSAQPDIQLARKNDLTSDPSLERVAAAVALPEGGLLALANRGGAGSFIYKFSSSGALTWRKEVSALLATAVGISSDGTYWVAGVVRDTSQPGSQRLTDFAQRVSPEGEVSQPTLLSGPTDARLFHCATEHDDKFIQLSTVDTLDEYFRMEVPAVSVTNSSGTRLWETLIPVDQGHHLEATPQQLSYCAGIFVVGDDRILAAQRIQVLPDVKTKEEILKEFASGIHLRPGTLLVALDMAGKEAARIRRDNAIGALLVPTATGAVLFETSYKKPGLSDFPGVVDQQMRMFAYDPNLKETRTPILIDDSLLDVIATAYSTPEGGFLFAACSGKLGNIFVRYVSSEGVVSPKRAFPELGPCAEGFYKFAAGEHSNEVLLLVQTPNQGNRLLTLKYSN